MSSRSRARGTARGRGFDPRRGWPTIKGKDLNHIASVSRSSGLERDGDTLKDFTVQEQYKIALEGKLEDALSRYNKRHDETRDEERRRADAQDNILILYRKLREGIYSSNRTDRFALEVYETSLYLTIIFNSFKQTPSVISHLLPDLYLSCPGPHKNLTATVLVSLTHALVTAYPSQSMFNELRRSIPPSLLPQDSDALKWMDALARCLRLRNYASFDDLSRASSVASLTPTLDALTERMASLAIKSSTQLQNDLSTQALLILVNCLREKARMTFWNVVRAAYREVSRDLSGPWLERSLCLNAIVPRDKDISFDQWLQSRHVDGHVRRKEGSETRWIILKPR